MTTTTEPETRLDATNFGVVVLCDSCSWRGTAGTRAGAWKLAALHLRRTHGAIHAARRATRCALTQAGRDRKREQSSEGGNRGTQGRNTGHRAGARTDRSGD